MPQFSKNERQSTHFVRKYDHCDIKENAPQQRFASNVLNLAVLLKWTFHKILKLQSLKRIAIHFTWDGIYHQRREINFLAPMTTPEFESLVNF